MEIIVKKTNEAEAAYVIAKGLPEFFDAQGLNQIKQDTQRHVLYGAFVDNSMVGFVTYKEINPDTIEMSWLGVASDMQRGGVGTKLVNESLSTMKAGGYRVCEVKTLSEVDSYEPYKKTRQFYKNIGFIPIETISPYPEWGDNPCQIFVRFINL